MSSRHLSRPDMVLSHTRITRAYAGTYGGTIIWSMRDIIGGLVTRAFCQVRTYTT
jgi:hypothetical protein